MSSDNIKRIKGVLRDPKDMGAFIKSLREEHNLTQDGLGRQMFVTRKAVSKWETGLGYPSLELVPVIAEVLNTTLDELLTGETSGSDYLNRNSKLINIYLKVKRNRKIRKTIITCFLSAFILLLFYFFMNYNATKVYKIYYNDNGIHVDNSILVKTWSKDYLSLGVVYSDFSDIREGDNIEYTLYDSENKIVAKYSLPYSNYHFENTNFDEIRRINIDDKVPLTLKVKYHNLDGEEITVLCDLGIKLLYMSNDIFNTKKDFERIYQSNNFKIDNNVNDDEFQEIDIDFLFGDLPSSKTFEDKDGNEYQFIKDINTIRIYNNRYNFRIKTSMKKILISISNDFISFNINSDNKVLFKQNKYISKQDIEKILNSLKDSL